MKGLCALSTRSAAHTYTPMKKKSAPSAEEIVEQARQRMAERKRAARTPDPHDAAVARERPWRGIFVALAVSLLLLFLFAPGPGLQARLFALVHGLVAQLHLVFVDGAPLPVCARNLGIYSSFLITMPFLFARGRGRAGKLPGRGLLLTLAGFVLVMAFDGFNSLFGDMGLPQLYQPWNPLRTVSGALFGIAMTGAILFVFNRSLRADVDRDQPVVRWSDIGGALLLNGLYIGLVYSNIGLLYWPLALFGVLGLVGELFVIHLLVLAMFIGYGRRITRITQLARPASFALLTNLIMVGAVAWLRLAGV